MSAARRKLLVTLSRYGAAVFAAALLYVLLDFAIDLRPAGVQSSYQFKLRELEFDRARILRQDNLAILVIRRSAQTIAELRAPGARLQDPDSARSRQPDYADNPLRSRQPEYFVSLALGTDLGCPLVAERRTVRESCGSATWDFAGRALAGANEFRNLVVPDYTFSDDFTRLTIRP